MTDRARVGATCHTPCIDIYKSNPFNVSRTSRLVPCMYFACPRCFQIAGREDVSGMRHGEDVELRWRSAVVGVSAL